MAHFAHLGGLAVGYGYLRLWDWRSGATRRDFKRKLEGAHQQTAVSAAFTNEGALMNRWEQIDVSTLHELNREEVQLLLAKARTAGVKSLTPAERQFLDRMI